MNKTKYYFLFIFFLSFLSPNHFAQSLIQTYPLPRYAMTDQGYGLVYYDGFLWMSSGSSSPVSNKGKVLKINMNGQPVDSFNIQYASIQTSQGLAHDGTNFWYLERKTAKSDFYKVTSSGVVLDSILSASFGAGSWYFGGMAYDRGGLWVTVYYPNNLAAIYKLDLTTKQLTDTIPVFGLQPQGVTFKGDTLFYVMDGFDGDPENIYAVDLNTKDTLFSFHVPEQPGIRQNPRGLAWDGEYLWLLAEPVNSSSGRALFKYDLGGSGTPSINLLTQSIDFGNVQIDTSRFNSVYIKNYGTADLIIDSIFVSNNDFMVDISLPFIIKKDSTRFFNVKFKPSSYQTYKDSILIFHNDPNFEFSKVKLSGSGIYTAPYVHFSETAINYGNKRIRSTSSNYLEISNYGSGILKIDSITLKTTNFKLVPVNFPLNIDSVSGTKIRIWFSPTAYTNYFDTLTVYSNASNGNIKTILLSATGTAFDSLLGSKMWEGRVPDNPSTSFDDYTARYIKTFADINGDGVEDIIVTTDNYQTIAFNGNSSGTADVLWVFSTSPDNQNTGNVDRQQSLQICPDLNNDGMIDVVIGTAGGSESVIAISGRTGEKLWEFGDPINYDQGDVNGIDVSRDWNNDGIRDVLASVSGNEYTGSGRFSVFLLNGVNGQQIWRLDQSATLKMKDAITATDDGGAVGSRTAGSTTAEVLGFDHSGNPIWAFPTARAVWGCEEIENIGGLSTSDVIAGDVGGYVYALTGDAGVQIWTKFLGNVFIEDLFIIPDMNKSGVDDILVSALTSSVFVLEGSTGNIILTGNTTGNNLGVGLLGDLNADSLGEVGVASLDKKIYVFDSKTGQQIFSYEFTGSGEAAECIWPMGDIDKNGTLEFAAGSRNGFVVAFSGGTDVVVGIQQNTEIIPEEFSLNQNYPNTFNPSTVISYRIPKQTKVSLIVYDVLGNVVSQLVNEVQDAGEYKVTVKVGENGLNLSSGIYFYRLEAGDYSSVRKMILLK